MTDEGADGGTRDDELDALATRGAHQLGEAVALLRGALYTLEQRHDPDIDDALSALRASAERSQRYTDDLLDLLAAGRPQVAGRRAELSVALAGALERLDGDLERAGATVGGDLPDLTLDLDPQLTERLLTHAVRAALAAGARRIEIAAGREGDRARVEVRDDAPPPEPGALTGLSAPRGRGALLGAGVSLAVCGRIVRRRGGDIEVGPRPGGGTVLRFDLPAAADGSSGRLDPPLRVALCDDAAELRALLRALLDDEDDLVVVGEAGDADGALRLAVSHLPEVIVLDLEMPGLSPSELVAGLRRAAPRASILTYSGHEPRAIIGPGAGAIAAHVPKTTELPAVARAVRELGRRERRAA